MAVQPDAKIVVGGWTTGAGADFAVARYTADGALDPAFGLSGKITTDFENGGNERISSMVLQPDGKIVASGFSDLRASYDRFAVARYNFDGSLDTSFGSAGKVTTTFFSGFDSSVSALALQPDGKIVSVGFAFFGNQNYFALARYFGSSFTIPTPTPTPTPNPSPSPSPAPLELFLSNSGPIPNLVAALDSLVFFREPFQVINKNNLLRTAEDPNTRIVIFVRNLQLLQGDGPSSVIVRLASNIQNHDMPAEDVRPVPNFDFAQVTFRLSDNLSDGDFTVYVIAHGQVSNSGIFRVRRNS